MVSELLPELCMLIFKHACNLPKQAADRTVTADGRQLLFVLCMLLLRHWSMTSDNASGALYATRRMYRRVDACIEENRKDSPVVYQPLERSGITHAHLCSHAGQRYSSLAFLQQKGLTQ